MIESLHRHTAGREYSLLVLRAQDRHRWFRSDYCELENRQPQETITSHLGITPVT